MRTIGLACAVLALLMAGSATGATDERTSSRHIIYLHGWIIQDQQITRPEHPIFGFYEWDEILASFQDQGFVVSGKIRPQKATVPESAADLVAQIRGLLDAGVPASHLTVVGASMGASIALMAASQLGDEEVRFVLVGTCLSANVNRIVERGGAVPKGQILAIREATDTVTNPCPAWGADPESAMPDNFREIVIDTGLSHGFLYRPLPQWVQPVWDWAKAVD